MTCANVLVILKAKESVNSSIEIQIRVVFCSLILLFHFHSSCWTAYLGKYRLCIWGRLYL